MADGEATIEPERPLWRRIVDFPLIAMLVAIAAIMAAVASASLLTSVLPKAPALGPQGLFDLIAIPLLVLVYKLLIRRLGEQPRDDLRLAGAGRPLLLGLLWGALIFSIVVAIAAAIGVYRMTGSGDASELLPSLIGLALFPAVSEEMLFRGVLFRWIEEFGGSWAALLVTSTLFGAAHLLNPNASPVAALGIAMEAGLMLGGAYMLTRSLWLPMGLHAAWNFTQGEVYDIPVSGTEVHGLVTAKLSGPPLLTGGGFGLEASVIAMVVAVAFGLWLLARAIRKGELIQAWWVRPQGHRAD